VPQRLKQRPGSLVANFDLFYNRAASALMVLQSWASRTMLLVGDIAGAAPENDKPLGNN